MRPLRLAPWASAAASAALCACVGVDGRAAAPSDRAALVAPSGPGVRNVESDRATDGAPFALLELFTSEGCSSCPPADEWLMSASAKALSAGQRVFPLSMHVTYWDGLGWEDPFGDDAFNQRQRAYVPEGGSVYTPQLVVSGRVALVGSDSRRVSQAVTEALDTPAAVPVHLTAAWDPRTPVVLVGWEAPGAPAGAALTAVVSELYRAQEVGAGENHGRRLTHAQVARGMVSLDAAPGAGDLLLTLPPDLGGEALFVTAFVQSPASGPILGATRVVLGARVEADPMNQPAQEAGDTLDGSGEASAPGEPSGG